jgi:hypothetical protein
MANPLRQRGGIWPDIGRDLLARFKQVKKPLDLPAHGTLTFAGLLLLLVLGYLESKFGGALPEARKAMNELADSLRPNELAENAFSLYEQFRPQIPEGVSGWGAKGELDLGRIRRMAQQIGRLA